LITEAAKHAGEDSIKLQTYTSDTMTINHKGPEFCLEQGLWKEQSPYELYQLAHTPWDWRHTMLEKGRELGINVYFSGFRRYVC